MHAPTPYDDLNEVLATLVDGVHSVLGPRLSALCLQGSFAVGGFDEHSDVDFVAAVDGPLTNDDVAALQEVHADVFDLPCPWAQHLEGSYFPCDVLQSAERRGEPLWYLDNGSRQLTLADHCNTLIVRQTVREHGVRLFGADPATLVNAIPVELLRADMLAAMLGWADEILAEPDRWSNRFYQGFITLNYCRVWCDATTGSVGSKQRAAAWAKERLDASWADLIDRAWQTRPDPATSSRQAADPDDFARTLQLLKLIRERCRALECGLDC